ncbi:MAG: GAF domain-containing protein [Bacteroidales bacterium]|nr:GAF domain-containing protein [Bacteroidales bacterium]MDD4672249.1 GAF domain-containing protein [Bacteroidales bacterium]
MKTLKNISINQQITIALAGVMAIMLCTMGLVFYNSFKIKQIQHIESQMFTYLDNMTALINEVEKHADNGSIESNYAALKPHFNSPAFYSNSYPFIVDNSGNYIIHLYREGQRMLREHLNTMVSSTEKKGSYSYTELFQNRNRTVTVFFQKIDSYNAFICIPVNVPLVVKEKRLNTLYFALLVVLFLTIFAVFTGFLLKPFLRNIGLINNKISKLAKGEKVETQPYQRNNEIGRLTQSLNNLIHGIEKNSQFASEISQNNLSTNYTPLGANDKLGNSLLKIRENLNLALKEEEKHKLEDEQRNWVNSGLAKFADTLRQNNDNLQQLADNVTQNLINYLDANQGGLFILNEDDEKKPHLELLSIFGYNRKKVKQKTILLGEGLVGNAAIEKQTIHLKEIPDNYLEITSGLGDAPPKTLLIVPLKVEDQVFGIIEIASFNNFKPYEVEFVERVGESIASTLSAVKNSIRTSQLLEQSQQQREEMAAQEEEMRQNMEEMQATQEEMARKTLEMDGMTSAINEAMLYAELNDEGKILNINTNFLNLLDFTRSEIEQQPIIKFIHPSNAKDFDRHWKEILQGNAFKGTLSWTNRNNAKFQIISSLAPAFDELGNIYKVYLIGQDITS